jgi:hypothetical protein
LKGAWFHFQPLSLSSEKTGFKLFTFSNSQLVPLRHGGESARAALDAAAGNDLTVRRAKMVGLHSLPV